MAGVQIFVARHGRSVLNEDRRISGQADAGLTEEGRRQAEALAEVLSGERLDAIYASPLRRAIETATPTAAGHGIDIQADPALMEIDMGALAGRKRDESDREALHLWREWQADKHGFRGHGGETFSDLERRVGAWLARVMENGAGKTLLVVAHRGTNRVILSRLMGWSPERALELKIRNRYLYRIEGGRIATIRLDAGKVGKRYQEYRE